MISFFFSLQKRLKHLRLLLLHFRQQTCIQMLSCPERLCRGEPQSPSFSFLSPCIIHPALYLQHSKNEPVTHPRECCWHIALCHVLHLIRSIQPPHVQTRHGYYASSADRKHGTGKLKSQETKEVAGEWKNKWWLPSLLQSGDMLRVILVSWYAVVRWWCAGQGQFRTESRAQGWQEAKRSNCSLSPNKYMDEWAHPPSRGKDTGIKEGQWQSLGWPLNFLARLTASCTKLSRVRLNWIWFIGKYFWTYEEFAVNAGNRD